MLYDAVETQLGDKIVDTIPSQSVDATNIPAEDTLNDLVNDQIHRFPLEVRVRYASIILALAVVVIAPKSYSNIVADSLTGPSTIEPGGTYQFFYELAGEDSFSSQATAVFYLTQDTIAPSGLPSEELLRNTTTLMFQDLFLGISPRYKAPDTPIQATVSIPLELTDFSWPLDIGREGSIPPGSYNIVINVLNTYAVHPVTIPEMEIAGVNPSSARIGEEIFITGEGLERASSVSINGEELLSFQWEYNSFFDRIEATVPSDAAATGIVEVADAFHSVASSETLALELPELEVPINPSWQSQILLTTSSSSNSPAFLQAGENLWLRFSLENTGTAPVSNLLQAQIQLDGDVIGTRSGGLSLAKGDEVSFAEEFGQLEAGSYTITIIIDPGSFIKELSESNNTFIQNFVILPHPVDEWRSLHFSSQELENSALESTLWGDFADPDGDGLKNLLEAFFLSSPLEERLPEGSDLPTISVDVTPQGVVPTLSLSQAAPTQGIGLSILRGTSLDNIVTLSPSSYTSVETPGQGTSVKTDFIFPETLNTSEFFQVEAQRIFE